MDYRLGPLKGNWMLVPAHGKSVNCLTDLSGVGGAEAFQDGSCQNADPHFDLVQPGGMRQRSTTQLLSPEMSDYVVACSPP